MSFVFHKILYIESASLGSDVSMISDLLFSGSAFNGMFHNKKLNYQKPKHTIM
jgi:hypothetical protein